MIQENKNKTTYNILNNSIDELVEIKVPDNWWISHNTYFTKKSKSLKIIEIRQRREKEQIFTPFPHWDIKNGDYFSNDFPSKSPISKELRKKIENVFFILILIVAGLFTWLVAYLVSKI